MTRPAITREQLQYCKDMGMSPSQAGTYLGRHHTTILSACAKFDIELPKYAHRYAAPTFSKRSPAVLAQIAQAKKEGRAVWSCSPAAIERALRKIEQDKRLK